MKKSTVFLMGFIAGSFTIVATLVASVLWFCCPAANPSFACMLLFRPQKQFDEVNGQEISGIKAKDVYIKSAAGVTLHGRLYEQKGAKQAVLYNHGQGGNISVPFACYKINSLLSTGATVLAYDYRGYGRSTGTPSMDGVVDDARAAFKHLTKDLGFTKDQIIVYGESLGTGISSELLKTEDCAGVVLESGFVSAELAGKDQFEILRIYPTWLFPDRFNNLRLVEGKHPPILIVGAGRDVFCHQSRYLYEHATQPTQLAVFEKCQHSYFKEEQAQFHAKLKSFFSECTKQFKIADVPQNDT